MADDVVVKGKVLEWGNSFGIRVKKADLLEAGIGPGTEVVLHLAPTLAKIDLSGFPFLRGGKPDDSVRHDELLAQAGLQDLKKTRGRRVARR